MKTIVITDLFDFSIMYTRVC